MGAIPVTSGHIAVPGLIARYAELIDAGDFAGLGALFAHATIVVDETGLHVTGAEAITAAYHGWTKRYDDTGTPKTKHVTTNLILDVDDEAGIATCRSYVTVFQATEDLPLQPIFSGRYRDAFERVDGEWRFAERRIITDFVGDMSRHVLTSGS
jgi:ketosteroid isomerase-like protein